LRIAMAPSTDFSASILIMGALIISFYVTLNGSRF
jgi:hypothetical protein